LAGKGSIQCQSGFVLGDTLYQGYWRSNEGWSRTVPLRDCRPQWAEASVWAGPIAVDDLPGSGDMQAQSGYVIGQTLHQGFWRGNKGYVREVPVVNGAPGWAQAKAWSAPIELDGLPGTGEVESLTAYVLGTTLHQGMWRGGLGYMRTVPIVEGVVTWAEASVWGEPLQPDSVIGVGQMQSQNAFPIGGTLHQGFWRGDQGWYRTVPIVAGVVTWTDAGYWHGPMTYGGEETPPGLPTCLTGLECSGDAGLDGYLHHCLDGDGSEKFCCAFDKVLNEADTACVVPVTLPLCPVGLACSANAALAGQQHHCATAEGAERFCCATGMDLNEAGTACIAPPILPDCPGGVQCTTNVALQAPAYHCLNAAEQEVYCCALGKVLDGLTCVVPLPSAGLAGSGTMRSQDGFVLGTTLYQGYWRGTQGWSRTVPIVSGTPNWNGATAWSGPIALTALAGTGDIQSQAAYVLGGKVYQGYWRGNQGYTREVPIVNNAPDWAHATAWAGPIAITALPGSGDMQAQASYILGASLQQSYWRGGKGYYRSVPIVDGVVKWADAGAWSAPLELTTLPGAGEILSQNSFPVGTVLHQGFWRGDQGFSRTVPIVGGVVTWNEAGAWSGPMVY